MSENLSANDNTNTTSISNTSSTRQGVDISPIQININVPSTQAHLIERIESSMNVGMVSKLRIKQTTIVNKDKFTKGK